MNTRKLLVTGFVLVCLALAVLITSRVVALQQPTHFTTSHSNQVFYSPSIERLVNRAHMPQITNQVFYSPTIENLVKRGRTTPITNQIFYSPTIESFVH